MFSIWVSAFNSPVKNLRWSFSVKIVNGLNLLIIFLKSSTLNARLCSEYSSDFRYKQSLLWWGTDIPNTHQGRRKLFYGGGSWVKMSASLKKKTHPNAVQTKKKFGLKYKWFKMSYLEFFSWKYYFGHTTFLCLSRRSSGHHQSFLLISGFLAESLKANKS